MLILFDVRIPEFIEILWEILVILGHRFQQTIFININSRMLLSVYSLYWIQMCLDTSQFKPFQLNILIKHLSMAIPPGVSINAVQALVNDKRPWIYDDSGHSTRTLLGKIIVRRVGKQKCEIGMSALRNTLIWRRATNLGIYFENWNGMWRGNHVFQSKAKICLLC